MDEFTYEIGVENAGERIDKFLSGELSELSRSYIQKLLKEGMVTLGGKALKANYRLREKDEIEIKIPPAMEPDILPENIPLDILYEDSDVLVVNKPKGMVVHPGAGHYSGTLVNALLSHCGDSLSGINGVMRPGIVHRIDRDTTGSLLVCKGDILIDHQSLDLMEGRRMCCIHLVCTEYSSGSNHSDGKLTLFHLMHLSGRGLGTKKNISCDIEGILFVLRRMICRDIQGFKVIIILFHLGAFHYLIAHAYKNSFNFL